jgi:pentatricopeptide repeat protein
MRLVGRVENKPRTLRANFCVALKKSINRKTVALYNTRLRDWAKEKDTTNVALVLDEMKAAGIRPNSPTYSVLIPLYAKLNDAHRVLALHEEMKQVNYRPCGLVYSTLIAVYAKDRQVEQAYRLYQKMRHHAHVPGLEPVNLLLHAMVGQPSVSLFSRAIAIFRQMMQTNVKPDEFTFTSLLRLYESLRARKESTNDDPRAASAVCALYDKLFTGSCVPNIAVFESLFNICAERGDLSSALGMRTKMQEANISPNLSIYNALIRLYCSKDSHNTHYTRDSSDSDENGSTQRQHVTSAAQLLDEMREARLLPNAASFLPLITCYARLGNVTEARGYFDRMLSECPNTDLDSPEVAACYSALLRAYASVADLSNAQSVFDQMKASLANLPDSARSPSLQQAYVTAYDTMLDLLAKSGHLTRALALFEELVAVWGPQAPSDVTYTLLIQALAHAREGALAEARFAEMQARGVRPNLWTYNVLIQAFANDNEREKVSRLRAEMTANGIVPDAVFYTTLIGLSAKRNAVEEVVQYLAEMKQAGLQPNGVTYHILMALYTRLGDRDAVIALWNEMRLQGFDPFNYVVEPSTDTHTRSSFE